MANALKKKTDMTPETYLEGELVAAIRSEFIGGEIFAMAGVTEAHNDITLNIVEWLRARLPDDCRVFSQGVKLRVDLKSHEDYYYPDVFVSCGPRDPKNHVRRDATLVIEILSPSTERVDRGEKFFAYTSLPSVTEYILVSQSEQRIEIFRRANEWKREVLTAADAVQLDSIHHTLTVAEVYRDIQL